MTTTAGGSDRAGAPAAVAGDISSPRLQAPFPWFGGKSRAVDVVWSALGDPPNYVEPFAGSAAMLLGRPGGAGRVETINDADGFVCNFWRAVAADPVAVAHYVDWPVNEADLMARHLWLVSQAADLLDQLHVDPEHFDAKIAGWWCWGLCCWIGSGWCSGDGPWRLENGKLVKRGDAGRGVNRQIPHLSDAGMGVAEWIGALGARLRAVRVAVGDWRRVLTSSVTTRHGLTGVFLDPPYTKGKMQYAAGGVGGGLSAEVRRWCAENGADPLLRIVLCGHAGEHDELLAYGWRTATWKARGGYALTEEARANRAGETAWCSPHCLRPNDHANLLPFSPSATDE